MSDRIGVIAHAPGLENFSCVKNMFGGFLCCDEENLILNFYIYENIINSLFLLLICFWLD